MTKTEIEEYLLKLEHKLLLESEKHEIKLTYDLGDLFKEKPAIYIFREDSEVCYVGETTNLHYWMNDVIYKKSKTNRSNSGSSNFFKTTLEMRFSDNIEAMLNKLTQNQLTISYIYVDLGRLELMERLLDKFKPKYNIYNNSISSKADSKSDQQIKNKNAYEKWTIEDDEKLEILFCEKKTTIELCEIFGRNKGAITSRIKKLELKEKYEL